MSTDRRDTIAGGFSETASDYDGAVRFNIEGAQRLVLSIPPGATLPYAIYSGLSTVDVRPGRLHAAAQISGVRGGLRVVDPRPVVVEASTCPPLPPGLNEVQQWASVSATEAKEIASRRGLTFQSRYPGDDPGPVDCNRVTAYQVRGASGFDAMLRG